LLDLLNVTLLGCSLHLQLPAPTMVRLLRRWGLGQAALPPQEDQEYFLDVLYDNLLYVAEGGSSQDVLERLTDMAG
jgi:hypothetical protein